MCKTRSALSITGNTVRNLTTSAASEAGGIYLEHQREWRHGFGEYHYEHHFDRFFFRHGMRLRPSIWATLSFNTTVYRQYNYHRCQHNHVRFTAFAGLIVNTGFNGASNDTIVNNVISDVYNYQDASVTSYGPARLDLISMPRRHQRLLQLDQSVR